MSSELRSAFWQDLQRGIDEVMRCEAAWQRRLEIPEERSVEVREYLISSMQLHGRITKGGRTFGSVSIGLKGHTKGTYALGNLSCLYYPMF